MGAILLRAFAAAYYPLPVITSFWLSAEFVATVIHKTGRLPLLQTIMMCFVGNRDKHCHIYNVGAGGAFTIVGFHLDTQADRE